MLSSGSTHGYTVLVVDDDPSVLATYRRLLCRSGYHTLTVDNPTTLLTNGHCDDRVDLLLIDYKMPGLDGLSLLLELRRRKWRARCILVSAYLNDEVRTRARELGVDRVLEKPVDVCLLRRAIHELLPLAGGTTAGCSAKVDAEEDEDPDRAVEERND